MLARQAAVCTDDLYSVPRLHHVHQVVVQDDVHRARQLAGWSLLRHLLHCHCLMVLIDGQTKLCFQRVVLLVLWEGGSRGRKAGLGLCMRYHGNVELTVLAEDSQTVKTYSMKKQTM